VVRRAWRKLDKWTRALGPDVSDEELHRARILTKRVRYAAEAVAPTLRGSRARGARSFAKRAGAVQDVLGELQDAAMAQAAIESMAVQRSTDGTAQLRRGRVVERQRISALQVRSDFVGVWTKLDRAELRGWMTT
jgi:CHAD domain-containing protein